MVKMQFTYIKKMGKISVSNLLGIKYLSENDINFYNRSEKKIHPTQKPTDLIQRIIDTAEYPQRILDPFSGSGSTYQAIKQSEFGNDHMFLGIEKDEEMYQKSIEYVSKR